VNRQKFLKDNFTSMKIKMQCTKTEYQSELEAKHAIKRLKNTSSKRVLPKRAYRCHNCGKRHITHEKYIKAKDRPEKYLHNNYL
jgi:hypothetical protein